MLGFTRKSTMARCASATACACTRQIELAVDRKQRPGRDRRVDVSGARLPLPQRRIWLAGKPTRRTCSQLAMAHHRGLRRRASQDRQQLAAGVGLDRVGDHRRRQASQCREARRPGEVKNPVPADAGCRRKNGVGSPAGQRDPRPYAFDAQRAALAMKDGVLGTGSATPRLAKPPPLGRASSISRLGMPSSIAYDSSQAAQTSTVPSLPPDFSAAFSRSSPRRLGQRRMAMSSGFSMRFLDSNGSTSASASGILGWPTRSDADPRISDTVAPKKGRRNSRSRRRAQSRKEACTPGSKLRQVDLGRPGEPAWQRRGNIDGEGAAAGRAARDRASAYEQSRRGSRSRQHRCSPADQTQTGRAASTAQPFSAQ